MGRRAEGLGKDGRTWREAAVGWERPSRAKRMEGVWVVSSRLGRVEGCCGVEGEREDVWPGSCFLKFSFITAVLQLFPAVLQW